MSAAADRVVCPKCSLETTRFVPRCHRCDRALGGRQLRSVLMVLVFLSGGVCLLGVVGAAVAAFRSGVFLEATLHTSAPLPTVLKALKHHNPDVRETAAFALLHRFPNEPSVTPALIDALGDSSETVRSNVRWALGARPEGEVVPLLLEQLSSEEVVRRQEAMQILWLRGSTLEGVQAAIEAALSDGDAKVRELAAKGLGVYPYSEALRLKLARACSDPEPRVRWSAASSLGALGEQAEESIPLLLGLLTDDADEAVRRHAAGSLGKIQRRPEVVVPALIGALEQGEFKVCRAAIQALERYGAAARSAAPAVARHLLDKQPTVRLRAGLALAELGDPAVLGSIADALAKETGAKVRAGLLTAQALLDPKTSREAVQDLIRLLSHGDYLVRSRAARCLGRVAAEADLAVPALVKILGRDAEPWARKSAAKALGKFGADSDVGALIKATQDSSVDVVSAAIASLGELGPSALQAVPSLQALRKISVTGGKDDVVELIDEALAKIGG